MVLNGPELPPVAMLLQPPLLELLLDDELLEDELEELLLDEELELLLDDELELLLEDELDDELELEPPPVPTQDGITKLPSWLPWKPNIVLPPGNRLPFQATLDAVTSVVVPPDKTAFQLPVTWAGSANLNSTVHESIGSPPLFVTVTSSW